MPSSSCNKGRKSVQVVNDYVVKITDITAIASGEAISELNDIIATLTFSLPATQNRSLSKTPKIAFYVVVLSFPSFLLDTTDFFSFLATSMLTCYETIFRGGLIQ